MNDYDDFGVIDFLPSGRQMVLGVYNATTYGMKKGYKNAKLLKARLDIHNKTNDIKFLENIIKECNNDPLSRLKQEKEKLLILENYKKELEKELFELTTGKVKSPEKKAKSPFLQLKNTKSPFLQSPIQVKKMKSPIQVKKIKSPIQVKKMKSSIQVKSPVKKAKVKKVKSPSKKPTRRSKRLQKQ
jgi:hypothetical protein